MDENNEFVKAFRRFGGTKTAYAEYIGTTRPTMNRFYEGGTPNDEVAKLFKNEHINWNKVFRG